MKEQEKSLSKSQAKILSIQTGVAYVHYFPKYDSFQVSIAKGSGSHVVAEYQNGKLIWEEI